MSNDPGAVDRGATDRRRDPGPELSRHLRSGAGVVRFPYPIGIRTVPVTELALVTPWMLRVTLSGPALAGFVSHHADDHVKIIFADPDGTRRDPVPNERGMLDWPRPLPTTRNYTVRRWDPDRLRVELDVVLHDGGLARNWARQLTVDDPVVIAGPPGGLAFPTTHPHYVLTGDPTAYPAIARWLDDAAPDLSADVVITADHPGEHDYPFRSLPGLRFHRLHRNDADLAAAVAGLSLPPGTFVFAAGEADELRPLRSWAKGRYEHSITGYWKCGVADHDDD